MLESCRRWRGIPAVLAIVVVACAAGADAASLWERAGPFQACLEQSFEKWLQARAELVLNEDPQAGNIDDIAVAQWLVQTVQVCRVRAGGGDDESAERFAKHVARWHTHIYDVVQSIRQRAGVD